MTTYYSVKLNVPLSKEATIKALVPDGESMSGGLLSILLDVAKQRGIADEDQPDVLTRRVSRAEKRITALSERVDALTALASGVRRG